VKAQIEPALALAHGVLHGWRIDVRVRTRPLLPGELIGPDALAIGDYESGRPVL
jgi:hypothetical protein